MTKTNELPTEPVFVALAKLNASMEHLTESVNRIDKTLHGNGRKGLVLRLDRLEQSSAFRGRWVSCVVAVLLTALITVVVTRALG